MDINAAQDNAKTLAAEFEWLNRVISARMNLYQGITGYPGSIFDIAPPDLTNDPSIYAQVVVHSAMNFDERVILLLSLIPHVQPHLLEEICIKNTASDPGFTEFGGIRGKNHSGIIPTGETAVFI